MKDNNKRIAIAVGIIVAIMAVIGLVAMTMPANIKSKYGEEAVRVLESYKSFDIDAKEASKRINDLADEVRKEMEKEPTDSEKYHHLWNLWLDLNSVHFDLYYKGRVAGYEIDEVIKKIKEDL